MPLKKAISLDPNSSAAYSNLGSVCNWKGLYNEAISAYKKVISLDPEDALAYNNLAIAYYKKQQYKKAIQYCDKAIELGYKVNPGFLKALKPYR